MEAILPCELHNRKRFLHCAHQINYDEFAAQKFVFYNCSSDVDVYELMAEDRLSTLLYGWNLCLCRLQPGNALQLPEEMCHVVKVLAHHSLQLWFSREWKSIVPARQLILLYYLKRAVPLFANLSGLAEINWTYILDFQKKPWCVPYLQEVFRHLRFNKQSTIEHMVPSATESDIAYLKQEGLQLCLLRLQKLFDAGSWEAVKQLSLRIMAAWLSSTAEAPKESLQKDETVIVLIGHLYLMTVFVADDNRGYKIDNMMSNIRFYSQSMLETARADAINITYTPARLIAQICMRLRLGKYGFFEHIIFKKFNLSLVTSFAVILQAYTSYALGNQLLELMAMNEGDFLAHLSQFKVLMYRYVNERENSERFLLNELQKVESQRSSHAQPNTVRLNLNYQQQICKGNRASNIGHYKNYDDDEKPPLDIDEERDRQIDPVFQNVPENFEVLQFIFQLLAQRKHSGWQFAKIVLLLKLIGHQLNTIEIWRYQPGLTIDFMINLEHKLSENYADLAKVFSEYGFMEAEFWLTAFYLHPTASYYNEVKRCSRYKRKRKEEEAQSTGKGDKWESIKYELLSSTIDVDEIVANTNHGAPTADYDPISRALLAMHLPRSILKDLLTVAFLPRNRRYSWALEWTTLHERCSALLKSPALKSKFVALNMAEANDQLQFLKIDYNKYKDRPQLDYGTIEEGYENAAPAAVEGDESEEEEEPQEQENPKKRSPEKKKRRERRKYWDEVISEEEEEAVSDDSDNYTTSTGRGTRVRAAAVVANAMITDMDRSLRIGRRSVSPTPMPKPESIDQATDSATETDPSKPPSPEKSAEESPQETRPFGEMLEARTKYSNETNGFKAFSDIWSFEKDELEVVKNDGHELMQSCSLLEKFKKLKQLKKVPETVLTDNSQLESIEPARFCDPPEDKADDSITINPSDKTLENNAIENELEESSTLQLSQQSILEEAPETEKEQEVSLVEDTTEQPPEIKEATQEDPPDKSETIEPESQQETCTVESKSNIEAPLKMHTEQLKVDLKAPLKIKTDENIISQPPPEPQMRTRSQSRSPNEIKVEEEPQVKKIKLNEIASEEKDKDEDSETKRLIHECLTRRVEVRLKRLTRRDIETLRDFRVRIKRTKLMDLQCNQSEIMHRKRKTGSSGATSSYTDSNPSTPNSDAQPSSSSRIRKRFKKFSQITSDSLSQVLLTKQHLKPFVHITSDSSTSTDVDEVSHGSVAHLTKKRRGLLKGRPAARISSPDIIELSSNSSHSLTPERTHFEQVAQPPEMDPLYEEAIVPYT